MGYCIIIIAFDLKCFLLWLLLVCSAEKMCEGFLWRQIWRKGFLSKQRDILVCFWKFALWYFALGNSFKSKCKSEYFIWSNGKMERGDVQFQIILKLYYWDTFTYLLRTGSPVSTIYFNFPLWTIFNSSFGIHFIV